ncbi:MAG: GGDEF domain-containing protein [Lachnospiraceae bacterium]|nr:GGDEF domain-containing protein [Lachnospiraceae bacterium]
MEYQGFIENFGGLSSVYAFDIMPDGSHSEIRLMASNKNHKAVLSQIPGSPKFYPGIPWRSYFEDINLENYLYRCGSTDVPLYSYVYAHGYWLKGFYIPLQTEVEKRDDGVRTVYVLYVLTNSKEVDPEAMSKRSNEASEAFIDISVKLHKTDDFYRAITDTVTAIKKICVADTCSIYILDEESHECEFVNEHGLSMERMKSIADSMHMTAYETAKEWERTLSGSDCLILDSIEVLKEKSPLWYASLVDFDINRIILYAIRYNKELLGFVWIANYDIDKMMSIKETLETVVFQIGSVIVNHNLVKRLQKKSITDELTGLYNRSAIGGKIDELIEHKDEYKSGVGIIYADLNGLKTVNDRFGHKAGDEFIVNAAKLFKSVYEGRDIYRIGGDEFVIICTDMSEEELDASVAKLRADAETSDISLAIGYVHATGDCDVKRIMQLADEDMYRDKEEYYKLHPEMNRRKR